MSELLIVLYHDMLAWNSAGQGFSAFGLHKQRRANVLDTYKAYRRTAAHSKASNRRFSAKSPT
jgi:hypothetical protein